MLMATPKAIDGAGIRAYPQRKRYYRRPVHKARATSLLNEYLEISGDLGMRLLVERVGSLQERPAAQPTRAPAYPDGLTQGEV